MNDLHRMVLSTTLDVSSSLPSGFHFRLQLPRDEKVRNFFNNNNLLKICLKKKRPNYYYTVWSEEFLYKVAPPELKISPIMYFVMYNSIVLSKILKIIVPLEQNFEKTNLYSIKLIILIIIDIDKQGSKWHNDFQYFG